MFILYVTLAFCPHPQILHVLSVYLRVYIDEVLLVYHYVTKIHTPVQLRQVVISSPTIGNDVGARETPLLDQWLQCLCCSVGHNLHHAAPAVPFYGSKNPQAVDSSPSVELPAKEIRLVDFNNNGLAIVVETSQLSRV